MLISEKRGKKKNSIHITVPRTCTSLSLVDGRARWNLIEVDRILNYSILFRSSHT